MNPDISERLRKEYHAEKVILYGSHARGEGTEDSDIDILVIALTNERSFKRHSQWLAFFTCCFHSCEFALKLSKEVIRVMVNVINTEMG
ncbi:MAG: nucleotidyltransferase family protein [bacterium]